MPELSEEIVSTAEDLSRCCDFLASQNVIGFDTEFVGEDTYQPRLCLVQVATPTRLFLIDPLSVGRLDAFWQLLVDPARIVVVHAGREEVRLCRFGCGSPPGRLFDLQLAAGLAGFAYPLGHGTLINQLVGARVNKAETLTEWRARPLTSEQIRYAFDDVRYLLRCREKLVARLSKLNRLEWAEEEFTRLSQIAGPEDSAQVERWRKIKSLGSLDRRKLAIVRRLYQWREERAAKANRPARTVVRDDLLVEIAKRNPTKLADLQVIRGLQTREMEAILEAVCEARQLPLDECPEKAEREQDPSNLLFTANILIAVLGDLCARQRLAANLVAGNSDVRALVRSQMNQTPLPADVLLGTGWRSQHILPDLQAVLTGKRAIFINDPNDEAPLGYGELKK
jgi:ribonuclease D